MQVQQKILCNFACKVVSPILIEVDSIANSIVSLNTNNSTAEDHYPYSTEVRFKQKLDERACHGYLRSTCSKERFSIPFYDSQQICRVIFVLQPEPKFCAISRLQTKHGIAYKNKISTILHLCEPQSMYVSELKCTLTCTPDT